MVICTLIKVARLISCTAPPHLHRHCILIGSQSRCSLQVTVAHVCFLLGQHAADGKDRDRRAGKTKIDSLVDTR